MAVGSSRFDLIAGGAALATAPNNSTNPDVDSIYQGFVGIAYQTPWQWLANAHAQPFIQLRVGAARGSALDGTAPLVELHLGLSTPERR